MLISLPAVMFFGTPGGWNLASALPAGRSSQGEEGPANPIEAFETASKNLLVFTTGVW